MYKKVIIKKILKGVIVTFVAITGMLQSVNAQEVTTPNIPWAKSITVPTGGIWPYDIQKAHDGGYVYVGYSADLNNGSNPDPYIVKIDESANVVWRKQLEIPGYQSISRVLTVEDGYVMLGFAESNTVLSEPGYGGSDFLVIKVDKLGNQLWAKRYGSAGNEGYQSGGIGTGIGFVQNGDGSFVVAGGVNGDGGSRKEAHRGSTDAWIYKIDKNGALVWETSTGGTKVDRFFDLAKTADGGYMTVGTSTSQDFEFLDNPYASSWLLFKYNANGELVWKKFLNTIEGNAVNVSQPLKILATSDGNFLVSGTLTVTGLGSNFSLNKFNPNGDLIWSEVYGGTRTEVPLTSPVEFKDGGYAVAGYISGYSATNAPNGHVKEFFGSYDGWVVRTDKDGAFKWSKTMGGSSVDFTNAIINTEDEGVIAVHYSQSVNGMVTDYTETLVKAWLVKFEGCGTSLPEATIQLNQNVFSTTANYENYQWYFNDGIISGAIGNSHTAINTGWYKLAVSNEFGCSDTSDAIQYFAKPNLFVPNVFTPNGDGKNDVLKIYGNQLATVEFIIFDQWGRKVFETRDPNQTWNGSTGGKAQPVGVYIYSLKATFLDGTTESKKGSVNLIR